MYRYVVSTTDNFSLQDLRIAIYNYITAKQNNKKFIVIINNLKNSTNRDSDKDIEKLFELFELFGIEYDQIIYQSENLKFYRQLATKLLMDKHAFSCFCTPKLLDGKLKVDKSKTTYQYDGTCKQLSDFEVLDNQNPFVIRVNRPKNSITFDDTIGGKIEYKPDEIDDFVILDIDKNATDNFALSIDDMLLNIKEVIRDKEYQLQTAREILIREYLGYDFKIKYTHVGNIEGKKIPTIDKLLKDGFLPSAIINYILLLGVNTPTELFNLNETLDWFDIKDITPHSIKFDLLKLKEINSAHIKMLDPVELSKYLGYSSRDLGELAKIYLKEASTINEIKDKIDKIFLIKKCENCTHELELLKKVSKDMPYFKEFDEFKRYLSKESGLKGKEFSIALRVLLTSQKSGPELNKIYPYIKNYLGEIIK